MLQLSQMRGNSMADVKTHLRELSVAIGIKSSVNSLNTIYNPKDFFKNAEVVVKNSIKSAINIQYLNVFELEHINIINNGFKLGQKLVDLSIVNPQHDVYWEGFDSQKNNPVDIRVGNIGVSLKEDSYILENMGLYMFLNSVTNIKHNRGLHVFKYFANAEYEMWFNYTWQTLIQFITVKGWAYQNDRYISRINRIQDTIVFNFKGEISVIPIDKIKSIDDFDYFTNSQTREKCFAKWIDQNLKNDSKYIELKMKCSNEAGQNLCDYINKNANIYGITRFLQIYDEEYYYAKSFNSKIEIFHIPSRAKFNRDVKVKKIYYSVPRSQLNIYTEIENIHSKNKLIIRNECRFSHGQLNGTPEAKMYYELGSDLSVIYNKIV